MSLSRPSKVLFAYTLSLVLLVFSAATPLAADGVEAGKVFDKLKGLEGTWTGVAKQASGEPHHEQEGESFPVTHDFRVSAAGSVVMEIMGPGSEHEMINMFHLDGQDLVLTHYCAAGNQPTMKLNRAASSPDDLVFDFTGGTNLNPAVDRHIHSSRIQFKGTDALESLWTSYSQGKQEAEMRFALERSDNP